MRSLASLATALALAACGFAPAGCDRCTVDGAPVPEVDAGPDGDPLEVDAGDAGSTPDAAVDAPAGGLPIDSVCSPTLDQCATGLTCRIWSMGGRCRPIGTGVVGQLCTTLDQCPANAACAPAEGNHFRCFLVCAVAQPLLRCTTAQTCASFPTAGPGVGLCVPL